MASSVMASPGVISNVSNSGLRVITSIQTLDSISAWTFRR